MVNFGFFQKKISFSGKCPQAIYTKMAVEKVHPKHIGTSLNEFAVHMN